MLERLQRMANFESQDFDAVVRISICLPHAQAHWCQVVALKMMHPHTLVPFSHTIACLKHIYAETLGDILSP